MTPLYPIYVILDDEDLFVARSIDDVHRELEAPDARLYSGFDSASRELVLTAKGQLIDVAVRGDPRPEEHRQRIQRWAETYQVPLKNNDDALLLAAREYCLRRDVAAESKSRSRVLLASGIAALLLIMALVLMALWTEPVRR